MTQIYLSFLFKVIKLRYHTVIIHKSVFKQNLDLYVTETSQTTTSQQAGMSYPAPQQGGFNYGYNPAMTTPPAAGYAAPTPVGYAAPAPVGQMVPPPPYPAN